MMRTNLDQKMEKLRSAKNTDQIVRELKKIMLYRKAEQLIKRQRNDRCIYDVS